MKTLSSFRKKHLTVRMMLTIVSSILLAFIGYGLYLSGKVSANFSFISLAIVQVIFTVMNCLWFSEAIKDEKFNDTCRCAWWLVLLLFAPTIYLLRETGAAMFIYITAFMPLVMTVIHCAEWIVKNVDFKAVLNK